MHRPIGFVSHAILGSRAVSRGVLWRNFYVAIGLMMIVLWSLTDMGERFEPSEHHNEAPPSLCNMSGVSGLP